MKFALISLFLSVILRPISILSNSNYKLELNTGFSPTKLFIKDNIYFSNNLRTDIFMGLSLQYKKITIGHEALLIRYNLIENKVIKNENTIIETKNSIKYGSNLFYFKYLFFKKEIHEIHSLIGIERMAIFYSNESIISDSIRTIKSSTFFGDSKRAETIAIGLNYQHLPSLKIFSFSHSIIYFHPIKPKEIKSNLGINRLTLRFSVKINLGNIFAQISKSKQHFIQNSVFIRNENPYFGTLS